MVNEDAMVLTGFRLILLICLFVSSSLYVTARQVNVREAQPVALTATAAVSEEDDHPLVTEPGVDPRPFVIASEPAAPSPPRPAGLAAAGAPAKRVGQEAPRKVEPVTVDAVRQPPADVPLDRNAGAAKDAPGLSERVDGNNVVAVAVDKENGRARNDVGGQVLGAGKKAGKAYNTRHRLRTAKARVKRHHRALAKANQRKRIVRKAKARKLVVQKRVKSRRRLVHAAPAFARVPKRKFEPLASTEGVGSTWFWSVR
jgi:hypothetical protein